MHGGRPGTPAPACCPFARAGCVRRVRQGIGRHAGAPTLEQLGSATLQAFGSGSWACTQAARSTAAARASSGARAIVLRRRLRSCNTAGQESSGRLVGALPRKHSNQQRIKRRATRAADAAPGAPAIGWGCSPIAWGQPARGPGPRDRPRSSRARPGPCRPLREGAERGAAHPKASPQRCARLSQLAAMLQAPWDWLGRRRGPPPAAKAAPPCKEPCTTCPRQGGHGPAKPVTLDAIGRGLNSPGAVVGAGRESANKPSALRSLWQAFQAWEDAGKRVDD